MRLDRLAKGLGGYAATVPGSRVDLSPMLEAGSVAVVGASQKLGSVGNQLIRQLVGGGFEGRIAPINPPYRQVRGSSVSNRSARPAPSTWPSWPSPTNDSKNR